MKNKLVASTTRCMKCGEISDGHLCKSCRTITVIDLLVKIANEEELPKRFKFMNKIFNKALVGDEWFSEDGYSFTESYDNSLLNYEIEILDNENYYIFSSYPDHVELDKNTIYAFTVREKNDTTGLTRKIVKMKIVDWEDDDKY